MPNSGARTCRHCGAINHGEQSNCLLCGLPLAAGRAGESQSVSPAPAVREPVPAPAPAPTPDETIYRPSPVTYEPPTPTVDPSLLAPPRRRTSRRWVWFALIIVGVVGVCCAVAAIVYLILGPDYFRQFPLPDILATIPAGSLLVYGASPLHVSDRAYYPYGQTQSFPPRGIEGTGAAGR